MENNIVNIVLHTFTNTILQKELDKSQEDNQIVDLLPGETAGSLADI